MFLIFIVILLFGVYIVAPNLKRNKQTDYFFVFLISITFAIVAYNAKPEFDLNQHFNFMDAIIKNNYSFVDMFTKSVPYFRHNRFYVSFNIICYLVAKTGNFHLLPFLFVFIDYLICGYISFDYIYSSKVKYSRLVFSSIILFLFMPFLFAVSGLRNALAACLMGLAIYLALYKNKISYKVFVLILTSVLMHPSTIIAIPFIVLSKKKFKINYIIIIMTCMLFLSNIATFFVDSNIGFISMLSSQYLRYTASTQYRNSRRYVYAELICLVVFLFILLRKVYKDRKSKETEPICNFFILYIIFILGNFRNYDMVLRPTYVLGPLSIIITDMVIDTKWPRNWKSIYKLVLILIMTGLSFWVISDYMKILFESYI